MLTEVQIKNLELHILGMFQSIIIPEITPNGYILAADNEGNTYPDQVATHHLVELCLEISPTLTKDVIENACTWFLNSGDSLQNPFLVTTIVSSKQLTIEDQLNIFEGTLKPNQKASGFIDLYAGFLDGGSAFSTLWAIRIASLLDCDTTELIKKAFCAIDSHWDDLHRNSFKGFYYELSNKLNWISPNVEKALKEILDMQDEIGRWDSSDLYTAYVTGNLLSGPMPIEEKCLKASTLAIKKLFDLDQKATSLPQVFQEARQKYADLINVNYFFPSATIRIPCF